LIKAGQPAVLRKENAMEEEQISQTPNALEVLREPWLRCQHRYARGVVCRQIFRERWAHRAMHGRVAGQLIAPRCSHALVDAVYIDRQTHRRLHGYAE
jgi:hypothetical protein